MHDPRRILLARRINPHPVMRADRLNGGTAVNTTSSEHDIDDSDCDSDIDAATDEIIEKTPMRIGDVGDEDRFAGEEVLSLPGQCEMCERVLPLTRHHLRPKDTHTSWVKRGFNRAWLLHHTIDLWCVAILHVFVLLAFCFLCCCFMCISCVLFVQSSLPLWSSPNLHKRTII